MACPIEELTAQGYDVTFGTNVIGTSTGILEILREVSNVIIGHWYLTERLMPALLNVARDEPTQKARVVTVSSCANYLETLHWDTFCDSPQRRKMSLDALYNQSKHVRLVV